MEDVSPLPTQALGSLLGPRAWSSALWGPPPTAWVLGAWEGGREGGGGKRRKGGQWWVDVLGLEDQGRHRTFPLPTQALGSLMGSWAGSSTFQGPLWLSWFWAGKKRRGEWGGALGEWRIRGGATGISLAHLGLRKLVGLPGLVSCLLGALLAVWVLGA